MSSKSRGKERPYKAPDGPGVRRKTSGEMNAETLVLQVRSIPPNLKYELDKLFEFIDKDASGTITVEEFESMFAELGISTTRTDMDHIFRMVNKDASSSSDNDIDNIEFVLIMYILCGFSNDSILALNATAHHADGAPDRGCLGQLWKLLEDPSSSWLAYFLLIFINVCVIISSVAFMLETLPPKDVAALGATDEGFSNTLETIDTFCVIVFTVEYVLRFAAVPAPCGGKARYMFTHFFPVIDILAILPFYVDLIITAATSGGGLSGEASDLINVARLLRLFRIMRILKLMRASPFAALIGTAFIKARSPLTQTLAFMIIFIVLSGSLLFICEKGELDVAAKTYVGPDGAAAPFQSIPDAMYYTMITMSTVGYGDQAVATTVGDFLSMVIGYTGIMLLAVGHPCVYSC